MNKDDKIRQLMLECIQSLQQHPNLQPPMFKSYLAIVYGDRLKKCGIDGGTDMHRVGKAVAQANFAEFEIQPPTDFLVD